MKHFKNLYKVVLGFYLCTALIVIAAEPISVTKDELDTQKELLQLQIDSKKELLQKDIESQNKRIDSVDKRIDDQVNRTSDISAAVDRYGVAITYIGLAITILLVGIGVFGYRTAKSDAREIAMEEAAKWFKNNEQHFIQQKEEIEIKLKEAKDQIDSHVKIVKDHSDAASGIIEAANEEIKILQSDFHNKKSDFKSRNLQKPDSSAVDQLAENLKSRSEDSYSFDDWNTRAFAAYKENKFDDALFYWDKAVDVPAAGIFNSAQAMFNKASLLRKLKRLEDANNAYEKLIEKFSQDTDTQPALRELIAKAMVNQGVTLADLSRYKEAICVYEIMTAKFDKDLDLKLVLANAMFNKASILSKLNNIDEAVTIFETVILDLNNDFQVNSLELLGKALNGKGFSLLCKVKNSWDQHEKRKILLDEAQRVLDMAIEKNPQNSLAYGNLAYVNWLKGDEILAEKYFIAGLTVKENGGEDLYKSTLGDFEIYPIEPDGGFKALVEKLWAEFQLNQKSTDQPQA